MIKNGEILGGILLVALFVVGVFVAQEFRDEIARYLDFGVFGMLLYVLAGILATVVAPITTTPLIPIAAALWGPTITGILNIISWTTGSAIAFIIARHFGQPLAARFVDLRKISKYERVLGETHLFWNVVFLRMAVPVDVLSYAIGLFTTMKMDVYIVATLVGVTPFAFILPYSSQASFGFQLAVGIIIAIMLYVGYRRVRQK